MLDAKSFGLSAGILWALAIFLMGVIATYSSWGQEFVDLMSSIYLGYGASWLGGIIGAVWAFVDVFIAGYLLIWLYNKISR